MYRCLVVIEKVGNNYSAYVPDLPGCVACGDTLEETEQLIKEAIIHGDSDFLRRATDEALAYLAWLNRFAEAEGLTEAAEAGD